MHIRCIHRIFSELILQDQNERKYIKISIKVIIKLQGIKFCINKRTEFERFKYLMFITSLITFIIYEINIFPQLINLLKFLKFVK